MSAFSTFLKTYPGIKSMDVHALTGISVHTPLNPAGDLQPAGSIEMNVNPVTLLSKNHLQRKAFPSINGLLLPGQS